MRKVILIFGKTGMGKSYLARRLIEHYQRVVILDPLHEYAGTIFFTFPEFSNHLEQVEQTENFQLVLRSTSDLDSEYFFKHCSLLTNCLIVVEEAEIFLDPRSIFPDFKNIINYGRHRNLSILAIGRRVPELSVSLRAQASTIISFQQSEPNDLLHLEEYGFQSDEIAALLPHKYCSIGESFE